MNGFSPPGAESRTTGERLVGERLIVYFILKGPSPAGWQTVRRRYFLISRSEKCQESPAAIYSEALSRPLSARPLSTARLLNPRADPA